MYRRSQHHEASKQNAGGLLFNSFGTQQREWSLVCGRPHVCVSFPAKSHVESDLSCSKRLATHEHMRGHAHIHTNTPDTRQFNSQYDHIVCDLMECSKPWQTTAKRRISLLSPKMGALPQTLDCAFYMDRLTFRCLGKQVLSWLNVWRDLLN